MGTSTPHFENGRLILHEVTSGEHYFLAPEFPTPKESGVHWIPDTGSGYSPRLARRLQSLGA